MPPPIKRDNPYVWVTWLRSLLSGEASCEWAAWFKAHYKHTKHAGPDDGKLAQWQIEHTSLLMQTRSRLRDDGFEVFSEQQNMFGLRGKVGKLGGKPDLIAIKDNSAWVIDVKTKPQFKVRDRAQVMLYMWALPQSDLARCRGLTFDGKLIGPNGAEMKILAEEVDEKFIQSVKTLLRRVCGDQPLHASPSAGECHYCDISAEDCESRIEPEEDEREDLDDLEEAF